MNKVFSLNEPKIINGQDMEFGKFGIVKQSNGYIKINSHVIKTKNGLLVCLETGDVSHWPDKYKIEIKDHLKLQRINKWTLL